MNPYSMSHLSDELLSRDLDTFFKRDHETTAALLARIAEYDQRKLYLPAGYPSMLAYCVDRGHYTEQAALKRIRVARTARRFPPMFHGLALGKLNLTAVLLLRPHLTEENAGDLLALAVDRSNIEIERLLAARFPQSDVLAWVIPTSPAPAGQLPPEPREVSARTVASVHGVHKVTALSTKSYEVQFTMSQGAHEKLRYVHALLGHRAAQGDIGQVFEQALDALIPQIETRRFAATARPRRSHRRSSDPRHIPADVKRAVWQRDGGQCTFVSNDGHRCQAETDLEFDHLTEVARGGEATVDGMRLLCRAHNEEGSSRRWRGFGGVESGRNVGAPCREERVELNRGRVYLDAELWGLWSGGWGRELHWGSIRAERGEDVGVSGIAGRSPAGW